MTAIPPKPVELIVYTRPTAADTLRQFSFSETATKIEGARALDMKADDTMTGRGWFGDGTTPKPVAAFADAMRATTPELLKVEGNLPPGVAETLAMGLATPGAVKEFLGEFPADGVILGLNADGKALGWYGELSSAPQAIKDVIAAANTLVPELPAAD